MGRVTMTLWRDWATPLTIGAFALMAVTGLLMFFHLDSGLNKPAHEWLSWVMVGGVALHATVNWPALKRHLVGSRQGRVILVGALLVIGASFMPEPGRGSGPMPPPMLVMQSVTHAPLARLAPLAGRPVETLLAELRAAGIALAGPEASLASVVGNDRGREGMALGIVFGSAAGAKPGAPPAGR